MRAAFCNSDGTVTVQTVSAPKINHDEVLLKVALCGLCGSDIKKILEPRPGAKPQVLGHEIAGEVVEIGKQITKFSVGDRLAVAHHVPCFECHYCRHENYSMCSTFKKSNLDPGGFAELLRIPATHVEHASFKIPAGIKDEEALFMEPLACCVRCLRRLILQKNDAVLVVGFGSIGFLFLQLLKNLEVKVFVTDLDDSRLELAHQLGAVPLHPKRDDVAKILQKETNGLGVDVVLFTAGNTSMLQDATNYVRDGGTFCLFSELKSAPNDKPLSTQDFYKRELTLMASYSPGPQDLKEAHRLISQRVVDLTPLKIDYFKLDEISLAVQKTSERKIAKAIIRP